MPIDRALVVAAALSAAACGGASPTAPGTSLPATSLSLVCEPQTALAGDLIVCLARATGSGANVGLDPGTAWSSSDPNILVSKGAGAFMGKSDTHATITVTYQGLSASTQVVVKLEDALQATAAAFQGTFKVGTIATMWLQGFYGVASADSGTLTLLIANQDGITVGTSAPLNVPHGGDRYLISSTLTLPPGTTRVCRTAVLQIGSTTLTKVPDPSLIPCFTVQP